MISKRGFIGNSYINYLNGEQMKSADVVVRGEDIVLRKVAGESILVPVCGDLADMQRIFALDSVGEFIWEHLNGDLNLANIAEVIKAEFDVEADQVERDLIKFCQKLYENKLVVIQD